MPSLSDNKQQFIINSDSIFINNNDDRHNAHVKVKTKGDVNANDLEFIDCHLKIVDGHLATKKITDLAGNSIIDISTNSIDFNNVTISNLNLGAGSVNASTVASSNGYASLDLELDAHLALINGKVAQNGHTTNKVFVSSNGGAFTTSSLCAAGDLAKLATNGAVDTNTTNITSNDTDITNIKAKTDFISVSQAVDLDTMESNIVTNTTNITSNDNEITSIKAKTDHISVSQAVDLDTMESGIATNTTNITSNDTDITNIKAKTDFISVSQAVDLDTMESDIAFNTSDIGTANQVGSLKYVSATNAADIINIKAKTDHISVNQTVNLDTMESGIATNTTNITSNDTDITNIKAKTDFISVSQAVNLDTMETGIATNSTNITSNDTDITNIKAKTDFISVSQAVNLDTMESGIATNTSNISTNTSNVANAKSKTDYIIVTQAVNLDTMESGISTNTSNINSNDSDIAAIETKTDRITYQNDVALNVETWGNLTLSAGAVGATTSYVTNKNGNLTLKGGYNGSDDSGKILLFTDNTERMIIENNGKVGIGTSPSNTLTINGAYNDTVSILGLRGGNTSAAFNNGAQIAFGFNGTDDYQHFIHTRHNSNSPENAIDFYVCDGTQNNSVTSGSTHNMSLVSGKVGIGDTAPSQKLTIKTGTNYDGLILNNENGHLLFKAARSNTSSKCYMALYSGTSATTGKVNFSNNGNNYITSGNVGIGTTSPTHPLEVATSIYRADFGSNQATYWADNASGHWNDDSNGTGNNQMSIKASGGILSMYGFWTQSDKRIKKEIVEIDDDLSLKKLRDISCCTYKYIDTLGRGNITQIGFIAQQVNEHLPNAISIEKIIIPNEMKKIHTSWNETKMSSNDLQDVSGVKYRFYVSNDISGNEEKMVESVGDENDSFIFEEKWENVFCYGKEVDDFHTLDKQKLFALNFSATQELDKLVEKLTKRIEVLEAKLAEK